MHYKLFTFKDKLLFRLINTVSIQDVVAYSFK